MDESLSSRSSCEHKLIAGLVASCVYADCVPACRIDESLSSRFSYESGRLMGKYVISMQFSAKSMHPSRACNQQERSAGGQAAASRGERYQLEQDGTSAA
mmetsp:Transcript_42486/g.96008  ORF Transcript_42486/g.96008 Transcript_42486/m.96008 type:complete len:100 (-) Transcript_42486:104-403(-)